ncbi:GNAT family N-acetyltransferase [Methanococcoides sp. SA1]|nr:GNAT family N-acetyltransferase [Methanococcoides sp. SA1]
MDLEDLVHLILVYINLQRQLLGSQLLAHSENELSGYGATTRHVEIFETNHQAVNFYKKNEWTLARNQKEQGLNIDRLLFEKGKSHNDEPHNI